MVHQIGRRHVQVVLFSLCLAFLLLPVSLVQPLHTSAKGTMNNSAIHNYYTVTPQTSNDVLLNPGKGWVLYGSPSDQNASTMSYATVGYVRYNWSDIEPTEGHYNWSIIDNDMNAWVAQGKQFAFGVMNASSSDWTIRYITPKWVFTDGAKYVKAKTFDDLTGRSGVQYEPVWDDPVFLQKVKDFLAALAQRYDNNPHIAYIDVRSYGNWGEGHVYGIPPSVALSTAGVQTHIQMYKNAFKHTQIVVPWGASDDNNAYDWAVNNGVGMRRDGLMVDSDGSELERAYGKQPSVYEFYGSYQWLVANKYWSDAKLINDVNIGKPSYIGMGQWGNDAQVMLANEQSLIRTLANHMGYDFVLNSATIPTTISNNQSINLSFSWSNQGVAYLYQPAKVAVALLDGSNNVVQKQWLTNSNPNSWAPGQTTTENVQATFSGLGSGAYKLAVGLFQNTTDSNPTYQLGNQGRTANGWYVLSNSVSSATVGAACQMASSATMPTSQVSAYPCASRREMRPVSLGQ